MRGRRAAALGAAGLLLLALALGDSGRAEVRPVEALGAVPLDANAPSRVAPRDAALQRALQDAVRRVALDELPDFDPETGEEALALALGEDPYEFANSYRIREDRGERRNLYGERLEASERLEAQATAYLGAAESPWGAEPDHAEIDELQLNQLRALGYVIK